MNNCAEVSLREILLNWTGQSIKIDQPMRRNALYAMNFTKWISSELQ